MIFELNLAILTKSADWCLYSDAFIHVCHDINHFKNYEKSEDTLNSSREMATQQRFLAKVVLNYNSLLERS